MKYQKGKEKYMKDLTREISRFFPSRSKFIFLPDSASKEILETEPSTPETAYRKQIQTKDP